MSKKIFISLACSVCLAFVLVGSSVFAQELETQEIQETEEPIDPETLELKNLETEELKDLENQLTQSPSEADLMPKADQPMAEALAEIPETQYTQALSFQETPTHYNLLKNSSFESFSKGQDLPPDSWQRSGIKISRNKTTKRFGDYSVKLYKGTGKLSQEIKDINYFKEEQTPLSFGCWVYSSTPNQVRLSLEDGVNTTYSNYHTGSGEFEFLNLTTTLSDSATNLKVAINLDSKGTVYVDGSCLYELITEAVYIPTNQDDLKMPSNLIYTDLTNQFVGIATDKPQLRLDVNGPLRIQNIWTVSPTIGEGLELLYDTSSHSALIQAYDRATSSLKDLYLQNQQFQFSPDGKLGIGLTPTEKLEVSGSIKATDKVFSGNNELLSQASADSLYVNQIGDTMTGDLSVLGNLTATKFFGDGSELTNLPLTSLWSQSGSNIYYNSGNVGIGTQNPETLLDVLGPFRFGSYSMSQLPAPGIPGQIAHITDDTKGLWMDQGDHWFSLTGRIMNVQEFGALGDGIHDDTAAIQAAIDAIPGSSSGDDYTNKSGGVIFFPTPKKGGFYKVSATLDFTEKWNVTIMCPTRYAYSRGIDDLAVSLIKWYGPPDTPVILFDYSYGITMQNISIDGRGISGVIGFSLSRDATQHSSVKFFTGINLDAYYCDIGMRIGDFSNNGPDDAAISLINCYFSYNSSIGLSVDSGNAVVNCTGLTCTNNGASPSTDLRGANIFLGAGELTLLGYTSAGKYETQPADADIYMYSGGIKIDGSWCDTHGPFLYSYNASHASYISGIRHWEGTMNETNTPMSIYWGGPQPLVLSGCQLYNDVEVGQGQSTHVIDLGTKFLADGAKFTGEQIDNYLGYIGLGTHDGYNEARLSIGKPPRDDGGDYKPLTIWSQNLRTGVVRSTIDGFAITEIMNSGDSSYYLLQNSYYDYDGRNFKSINAGKVGMFHLQAGGNPKISFTVDNDANAANQVINFSTNVFNARQVNAGSAGMINVVQIGSNSIGWAGVPPTTGTWQQGDVIYNINASVGAPQGWQCIMSGSPGTWIAMQNLAAFSK